MKFQHATHIITNPFQDNCFKILTYHTSTDSDLNLELCVLEQNEKHSTSTRSGVMQLNPTGKNDNRVLCLFNSPWQSHNKNLFSLNNLLHSKSAQSEPYCSTHILPKYNPIAYSHLNSIPNTASYFPYIGISTTNRT